MLRITTNSNGRGLVLRLEGRLEGPWVAVLQQSFDGALTKRRGRKLCVDLNGVTFVDARGKAKLAEMHAQGAELLGDDIETKALVAEIKRVEQATVMESRERRVAMRKPTRPSHSRSFGVSTPSFTT